MNNAEEHIENLQDSLNIYKNHYKANTRLLQEQAVTIMQQRAANLSMQYQLQDRQSYMAKKISRQAKAIRDLEAKIERLIDKK